MDGRAADDHRQQYQPAGCREDVSAATAGRWAKFSGTANWFVCRGSASQARNEHGRSVGSQRTEFKCKLIIVLSSSDKG
jgi:hypothetical protein